VIDKELDALMTAFMREPFPAECRGLAIHGVELVLLDADIYGVATWYRRNRRPLTDEHRALLTQLVADADRVLPDLPTEHARVFYGKARDLGTYLLESRGAPLSN
jgi:hypothetical protein